jgi:mono/diheme cytochrome c family protein
LSVVWNTVRPFLAALAAAALALPLAACGRNEPDLSNGKALFVEKCGSCHELGRAGTQGQTGPSLDAAFNAALEVGFTRKTVQGVVRDQIANARRNGQMPPNIVTGDDARDVAAYVAFATGKSGEDQGALAQAGLAGASGGQQIFVAAGCGSCHTFSKAGTSGNVGPSLNDLTAAAKKAGEEPEKYVEQSIVDPSAVVVKGYQDGVMPPNYGERLSKKQIQALTDYLLGK